MSEFESKDFVEMPPMEFEDLLRYLAAMSVNESCCGASRLPCGHYLSFLRINGITTLLSHTNEADAIAIGTAASALIDAIDGALEREHGIKSVDVRHVMRDMLLIERDLPSSDG